MGNPSPMPKTFPETREMSLGLRHQEISRDGFPNTSLVFMEHRYNSHHICHDVNDITDNQSFSPEILFNVINSTINIQVHEHGHVHGRVYASLHERVHCDACDYDDGHGDVCACEHGCGCSHGYAGVHVDGRGYGCVRAHGHVVHLLPLCDAGGGWHAQQAREQDEALVQEMEFFDECAPCVAHVQQQGQPQGGGPHSLHDENHLCHNPSHWLPVAGHNFLVGRSLLLVDQLLEPALHMEGATPEIELRGNKGLTCSFPMSSYWS